MPNKDLRLKFNFDAGEFLNTGEEPKLLVTVTRLPTGALETAVNTVNLLDKLTYIQTTYNEYFEHRFSSEVVIVGYILC